MLSIPIEPQINTDKVNPKVKNIFAADGRRYTPMKIKGKTYWPQINTDKHG